MVGNKKFTITLTMLNRPHCQTLQKVCIDDLRVSKLGEKLYKRRNFCQEIDSLPSIATGELDILKNIQKRG